MAINIKTGHFRDKDKSRYLKLFIHDQLLLEKCIFVEAIINVYQKEVDKILIIQKIILGNIHGKKKFLI